MMVEDGLNRTSQEDCMEEKELNLGVEGAEIWKDKREKSHFSVVTIIEAQIMYKCETSRSLMLVRSY